MTRPVVKKPTCKSHDWHKSEENWKRSVCHNCKTVRIYIKRGQYKYIYPKFKTVTVFDSEAAITAYYGVHQAKLDFVSFSRWLGENDNYKRFIKSVIKQ